MPGRAGSGHGGEHHPLRKSVVGGEDEDALVELAERRAPFLAEDVQRTVGVAQQAPIILRLDREALGRGGLRDRLGELAQPVDRGVGGERGLGQPVGVEIADLVDAVAKLGDPPLDRGERLAADGPRMQLDDGDPVEHLKLDKAEAGDGETDRVVAGREAGQAWRKIRRPPAAAACRPR